jgi:hypothetical protein
MINLLLIVSILITPGESKTLVSLRKLYSEAATKKESFKEFKSILEKNTDNTAILNGYRGCSLMLEANYLNNPISKLNYFNKGKDILEKSIKSDSENIELRYLRFTIQSNAPSILGYTSDIKSDKKFLLKNWNNISDLTLKNNVISFLKNSDQLTDTEKKQLND